MHIHIYIYIWVCLGLSGFVWVCQGAERTTKSAHHLSSPMTYLNKTFRSLMGPPTTCDVLGGHPTAPVKHIYAYVCACFWRQDCAARMILVRRVRSCVCCCHEVTPKYERSSKLYITMCE